MQKPYRSGTVSIPNSSTDFPILETIFLAGWLNTLLGAPTNIVLRYDRNISWRLGAIGNDLIESLNTNNVKQVLALQDIQTWWTDTLKIPEIYITNSSGGACNCYVEIYGNRFK